MFRIKGEVIKSGCLNEAPDLEGFDIIFIAPNAELWYDEEGRVGYVAIDGHWFSLPTPLSLLEDAIERGDFTFCGFDLGWREHFEDVGPLELRLI